MYLSFSNDGLRALCNSRSLLRDRFGEHSMIVERRLLTLATARVLGDVSVRPPDRRRPEPEIGPDAVSVCVREAGRIYFKACGLAGKDLPPLEEVDHIEIFAVGRRRP
jgi:hypothetical protein